MTAPPELRDALVNLMLAATPFARRRPRGIVKAKPALQDALKAAHAALHAPARQPAPAPVPLPLAVPQTLDAGDPEQLLRAFAEAGGKWTDMVAAVNASALEYSTRRRA